MLAALSRKHIACGPAWGGPAPVRGFEAPWTTDMVRPP
jgi:hypothetical protein